MGFRVLLFLLAIAASATSQTVAVPTANVPPTDPNVGIVCPKARQVLELNHQKQVIVQDFIRAQRIRRILQQKMDVIFQQFDVLIAPSQPIGASPLNANLETDLAFADPIGGIGNLCGLPALSVPCGFTKGGLPIGIQFLSQVLNDDAVIAAAEIYQARTDWHRKPPPLS